MSLMVLQQYISILRDPEANTKKDLRKAVVYIFINVYYSHYLGVWTKYFGTKKFIL